MDIMTREQRIHPIGKYQPPAKMDSALRITKIAALERLPSTLRELVDSLREADHEKRYRSGGWTVRQLVHHLADSHCNAYIRLKLALTEHHPTIAPYDENRWAELPDNNEPLETSLRLIESIHSRLCSILQSMRHEDFMRAYYHPGYRKDFTLDELLALYAWHGLHHQEQIRVSVNTNQDELD